MIIVIAVIGVVTLVGYFLFFRGSASAQSDCLNSDNSLTDEPDVTVGKQAARDEVRPEATVETVGSDFTRSECSYDKREIAIEKNLIKISQEKEDAQNETPSVGKPETRENVLDLKIAQEDETDLEIVHSEVVLDAAFNDDEIHSDQNLSPKLAHNYCSEQTQKLESPLSDSNKFHSDQVIGENLDNSISTQSETFEETSVEKVATNLDSSELGINEDSNIISDQTEEEKVSLVQQDDEKEESIFQSEVKLENDIEVVEEEATASLPTQVKDQIHSEEIHAADSKQILSDGGRSHTDENDESQNLIKPEEESDRLQTRDHLDSTASLENESVNNLQNGLNHSHEVTDGHLESSSPVKATTHDAEKPKLKRQDTMYENADVITFVSRMKICCAIFKNPADHRTHYYRRRYRGGQDDDGIPLELRNIAASFRVWGQHWHRIHNIKICQKSCAALEEPSKGMHRLDDQREDCQTKFGCRISLQDFDMMGNQEKNVLGDLLDKIHNCCVSEDDLAYFNLQDDSDLLDNYYFDL